MRKSYLKRTSFLFSAFLMLNCFTACNKEKAEAVEDTDTIEASLTGDNEVANEAEEEVATGNADCDQFLEDYEAYINDYVDLASKMKANPSDATIISEYSAMAAKASTWNKDIAACQGDAAFISKYTAMSTKLAQKLAAVK